MTLDTFKMEAIAVLTQPGLLTACVRRLLSEERNSQLRSINVRLDDLSLSYEIMIDMFIQYDDYKVLRRSTFEIPEFTTGLSSALVIEMCLDHIDSMVMRPGK